MHVRSIGDSKLIEFKVSVNVDGCLSCLSLCGSVMDWRRVQGASCPMTAGISSSPPATLSWIKWVMKIDRWMDGWIDGWMDGWKFEILLARPVEHGDFTFREVYCH